MQRSWEFRLPHDKKLSDRWLFGMLKRERVHHRRYHTQNEARADIFDYIERFHNPKMRRRVTLNGRAKDNDNLYGH